MQYFLIATMLAKCMRETYESIDMVIQEKMSILQSELRTNIIEAKKYQYVQKSYPKHENLRISEPKILTRAQRFTDKIDCFLKAY